MNTKKRDNAEFIIDLAEIVIVGIFAILNWTSSIVLIPYGSRGYWSLTGLMIAYLIVLLVKFLRKYPLQY